MKSLFVEWNSFALLLWMFVARVAAVPADLEIISIQDPTASPEAVRVLYLGYQENNHHSPTAVFNALLPTFENEGVQATFSGSLSSISVSNLANYDALMMYGNANSSGAGSSNQPLVPIIQQYVRDGGALVGLHVASAAFRNDRRFSALLGGRFQSHTAGTFTPENVDPNHVLLIGHSPLTSYDETYILKEINPDIRLLQERVAENGARFAWTWTRQEELGRVFYTASGHVPHNGDTSRYDPITKPEFNDLVVRGLHWATRRHFSDFGKVVMGANGTLWSHGIHRPTGRGCLWRDSGDGPILVMMEGSPLSINGKEYVFGPAERDSVIPSRVSGDSAIVYRSIIDGAGVAFSGLWEVSSDLVPTPLIVTGEPFPTTEGAEEVVIFGAELGRDYVASETGMPLFRTRLKSSTSLQERTVVAMGGQGIVLSEGQTLEVGNEVVTLGDLSDGRLAVNEKGNFVAEIRLEDGACALAASFSGEVKVLAIEGQAVPDLPNVQWGEYEQLILGAEDDLYFMARLDGEVHEGDDSALFRYRLATHDLTRVVREGEAIQPDHFVTDLCPSELVVDPQGRCHFFAKLRGPQVTSEDDQVLLSVGSGIELVVREGGNLPTFVTGSTMGDELGLTPLSVDEAGNLYFGANVMSGGNSRIQLFQVIGSTVFGILGEGDAVSSGLGTPLEIEKFESLSWSGADLGSSTGDIGGHLAVVVRTTSGHRVVLRIGELSDLDGDGFPNILEAGVGSDPLIPSAGLPFLPKIEAKGEERYYTFLNPMIEGLPVPELQESDDLQTWHVGLSAAELWEDQSFVPSGFQKLGVSLAVDGGERQFLRLNYQPARNED